MTKSHSISEMPYSPISRDPGPHWTMGKSKEEDRGYRRGFDQGVAALAQILGVYIQETAWKARVADFRHYRLMEAPCEATEAETQELLNLFPNQGRPLGDDQVTALMSALDLLTNCVTPDYADQVLGDYRPGGSRHKLAQSLYRVVDKLSYQPLLK
jgi:hypothetical protein